MRHFHCAHRAFTLIEVLVSMTIASILFTAIGSCIMIAARSYPSQSSPLAQAIIATQATDMMAADLRYANKVVSGSTKSLIFTVADRTGDNIDEVIAYVWSGTPGDPLLRYFNSTATEPIATSVQGLTFQYDIRTIVGTTSRKVLDRVVIDLDVGSTGTSRATRLSVIAVTNPEVQ
jgi:prepilin-type N-terminal cleavage/methylation domain-containing protein